MKLKDWFYLGFSTLLIIIYIIPFIYLTKYSYLSADDFCRATGTMENFSENFFFWYSHHNGRFINALFSYLPVYNTEIYKLTLSLSMIILGIAMFYYVKKISDCFGFNITIIQNFFVVGIFYVFFISQLPSPYEMFYWYAGTTAYMLSLIGLLFLIGILIEIENISSGKAILSGLVIITINGNNEILILFTNLLLFSIFWCDYLKKKKINFKIISLNLVSWISSAIVIFSPGSLERKSYFPGGGDLFYSLKAATLSSGMFTIKNLFSFPGILLFFIVILFFLSINIIRENDKLKMYNPLYLSILSFLLLCSILFVPYYAIGGLNVNSGRIGNIIYSAFWIILFFNLANFSAFLKVKIFWNITLPFQYHSFMLVVFLIFLSIFNPNYNNLLLDFKLNNFAKLEKKMEKRNSTIKSSTNTELVIEEIEGTKIVTYKDISSNGEYWINECYKKLINKKFNKNYKSIIIK